MALDTVTREWVVVYEACYETNVDLFTRPLNEWREMVEWEGKQVQRFTRV